MMNKTFILLSLICISLMSFSPLAISDSNTTPLFSPALEASIQMNSMEMPSYAHAAQLGSFPCPFSGGVILYRNVNFDCAGLGEGLGYVFRSTIGWQNVPEGFNDKASSIRIPAGWSVKLWEFDNRSGASVCRSDDDTSFVGDYFDGGVVPLNDRVDSFEVFGNSGCDAPPHAPALISPPNGSRFETTAGLSLDWASSAGSEEYYARLWGDAGVNLNSGWTTKTDWLFGVLGAGAYSWQVKARNSFGESAWSETWNFIVTRPPVRITQVWTGDGSWNPKTTFNPGDTIQWVIDIENLTGANATIDVTYEIEMENGDTINYWHGSITTSPGTLSWGLPGVLPSNRGGIHMFTGLVKYQLNTTQDISDYALSGPYVDGIFADGFESGNLMSWSAKKTDSGDLAVTSPAALKGAWGMRALIDDNNSIYITDATPYRDSKYRVRFYFDPNSIAMQNLDDHRIFIAYDHTADLIPVIRLEFRKSNSDYQVRAGARNDNLSTWTNTQWFTISDGPHYFEIVWKAATSPGANNGVLNLWIDGVMRANRGNVDNDTFHIDEINLGAVAGIDTGTRGAYYFDAYRSTHTSSIGPAMVESASEPNYQIENVSMGPPVSK